MNKLNKFSPEIRERAVRMVQGHSGEHPSLWVAVESIRPKLAACGRHCWLGSSGMRLITASVRA